MIKIDRQWEYRRTLMRDKKSIAAEVVAKLVKQSYCPGKILSIGEGTFSFLVTHYSTNR